MGKCWMGLGTEYIDNISCNFIYVRWFNSFAKYIYAYSLYVYIFMFTCMNMLNILLVSGLYAFQMMIGFVFCVIH